MMGSEGSLPGGWLECLTPVIKYEQDELGGAGKANGHYSQRQVQNG